MKIRSDLFPENFSQNGSILNIQEEASTYVVPPKQKYVTLSMKNRSGSSLKEHIQEIINKQKMKASPKKNIKVEVCSKKDSEAQKSFTEMFSNNMKDACKVKCRICDNDVVMSSFSTHSNSVHCLKLSEYTYYYGDHKKTISRKMYHSCGLCKQVLLLDLNEIKSHLFRGKHNLSLTDYREKFMKLERSKRKINKHPKRNENSPAKSFEDLIDLNILLL